MSNPKYVQRRNIKTRMVDNEAFLITRTTIKHLNPTATLIWCSLTKPISAEKLCAELLAFVPTIDKTVFEKDTLHCLQQFQDLGIVTISH
jgi:hypothetical protein